MEIGRVLAVVGFSQESGDQFWWGPVGSVLAYVA